MSETPEKGDSKKGLGRGLGDLLAQHDTDLPFLGAYGAASGDHVDGIPASAGEDDSKQLLAAISRHLKSIVGSTLEGEDDSVEIPGFLIATISADGGVQIDMTGDNLPLVLSDLSAPGLVPIELADDRSIAKVRIVQWGLESRRLLDRHCEFIKTL
ncbi:MAG: hypothetical protein HOE69_01145 [Euryarchaeota archaeon]|jgi:hypothetical protein|nr:hypothetical protein [Euryarchaeota archaeon]